MSRSPEASEPWDEDAWRLGEWLGSLERDGDKAADLKARTLDIPTFAIVLFWTSCLSAAALREESWWLAVVAGIPSAVHFWGIVTASGPRRTDDFVRRRIPGLLKAVKRRREALLAANAENVEWAARQEEGLRSELADYFRSGPR